MTEESSISLAEKLLSDYHRATTVSQAGIARSDTKERIIGTVCLLGLIVFLFNTLVGLELGASILPPLIYLALVLNIALGLNLKMWPFPVLDKILLYLVARPLIEMHASDRLGVIQRSFRWKAAIGSANPEAVVVDRDELKRKADEFDKLLPYLPKWSSVVRIAIPPVILTLLQVLGLHLDKIHIQRPVSVIPLAVFVLLLLGPGFRRKRRILEGLHIYPQEGRLFAMLEIDAPTEFQWDIAAMLALLAVAV